MREWLEQEYPHHGIYGGRNSELKEPVGDFPHYRWILDPIDGTKGFHRKCFSVRNIDCTGEKITAMVLNL